MFLDKLKETFVVVVVVVKSENTYFFEAQTY